MNITVKKTMILFLFLFYILSNLLFYRTGYKDYPNFVLLFITSILFISEVSFWSVLFKSIGDKRLSERNYHIEMFFMIGLIGYSLSRIFLTSSPYINDLLNSSIVTAYIIGVIRLVFMFSSIMNIFYLIDTKNIFLVAISIFNIISSILIWLDFDTGINAGIRILTGILAIIYIISVKNKNSEEV
ncbi:hypothetical protein EII29_00270 [Leptotrichia sp. OH3620_COT-345]|uniref:hypothetical protein n=1 Tax=Leptotrichia sp. OH3620_COT-345 TaxID=2491048 RepID=UPI000F6535A8|nr:hypothetical protein [Leptotrichia sp. OH3620_COT-345]RRD40922.1 hypothetical protein EII29_00270 [Leptotrichia sp. OH3620_COT-345]